MKKKLLKDKRNKMSLLYCRFPKYFCVVILSMETEKLRVLSTSQYLSSIIKLRFSQLQCFMFSLGDDVKYNSQLEIEFNTTWLA